MGTLILAIVSLWAAAGIWQPRFIVAIPQVLVWVFPIWLLLLIFIITPARMWNAIRKEKEELEQRLEPKLAITSGTGEPFVHEWLDAKGEMCRTFRICVKNISDGVTVHDARVVLIGADPLLEFVPVPLHLKDDNPLLPHLQFKRAFDLNPGGKRYADVFWSWEDPNRSTIGFLSAARNLPTRVPKQRYALIIQATGQDVPDCRERFIIDVGPEGEVAFLPDESSA